MAIASVVTCLILLLYCGKVVVAARCKSLLPDKFHALERSKLSTFFVEKLLKSLLLYRLFDDYVTDLYRIIFLSANVKILYDYLSN